MNEFGLSRDERETLQAALNPGEEVLWAGKPVPRCSRAAIIAAIVRLVVSAAFLLWFLPLREPSFRFGGSWPLGIVLPIVFFLLLFLGRPLVALWRGRMLLLRSVYAVTDRRCLSLNPGYWGGALRLNVWEANYAECRVRKDGSGDIVFRGRSAPEGFMGLPDVNKVRAVIDGAGFHVSDGEAVADGAESPVPSGERGGKGASSRRISGAIPVVCALLSLVFLGLGAYTTWDSCRVLRGYARTSGLVTSLRWKTSTGRRGRTVRTASAVFEYRVNGVLYKTCEHEFSNPPSAQVGETVEVLYHPSYPSEARLNTFMAMWFSPAILSGMGFFLLVASAVAAREWRRRRKAD